MTAVEKLTVRHPMTDERLDRMEVERATSQLLSDLGDGLIDKATAKAREPLFAPPPTPQLSPETQARIAAEFAKHAPEEDR